MYGKMVIGKASMLLVVGLLVDVASAEMMPKLQRFAQRDAIQYRDAMSLYSYVGSAPTHVVDSLGRAMSAAACQTAVENALKHNAKAKCLQRAMQQHKPPCSWPPPTCCNCSPGTMGTASATQITICANAQDSGSTVIDTVVHELVHAYDRCTRGGGDPDCQQRACSEIRAFEADGCCNPNNICFREGENYVDCIARMAAEATHQGGCGDSEEDARTRFVLPQLNACMNHDVPPFGGC